MHEVPAPRDGRDGVQIHFTVRLRPRALLVPPPARLGTSSSPQVLTTLAVVSGKGARHPRTWPPRASPRAVPQRSFVPAHATATLIELDRSGSGSARTV